MVRFTQGSRSAREETVLEGQQRDAEESRRDHDQDALPELGLCRFGTASDPLEELSGLRLVLFGDHGGLCLGGIPPKPPKETTRRRRLAAIRKTATLVLAP